MAWCRVAAGHLSVVRETPSFPRLLARLPAAAYPGRVVREWYDTPARNFSRRRSRGGSATWRAGTFRYTFEMIGGVTHERGREGCGVMQIALVNPRKVLVPLKDHGKRNGRYNVYSSVRPFLERQGWRIAGEGTTYMYVEPPEGMKRPFRIAVEIPTREQVEKIAEGFYATRQKWSGYVGEWWACYFPPEHHGGSGQFAHFSVGDGSLWTATVSWMPDEPEYRESASFPLTG